MPFLILITLRAILGIFWTFSYNLWKTGIHSLRLNMEWGIQQFWLRMLKYLGSNNGIIILFHRKQFSANSIWLFFSFIIQYSKLKYICLEFLPDYNFLFVECDMWPWATMQQGHSKMFVHDSLFRNIAIVCGSETPNILLFSVQKQDLLWKIKHPEEKRTILELRKRSGNSLRVFPLHTKKEKVQTINDFQR